MVPDLRRNLPMNITQIKYVLEIARSSSIREAATKLFISQPALGRRIKALEEELGYSLVKRCHGDYLCEIVVDNAFIQSVGQTEDHDREYIYFISRIAFESCCKFFH